jgi:hypothetical protein
MSDTSQGPGWWQASDKKWYPPERHASYAAPPHPPGRQRRERGSGAASVGRGCLMAIGVAAVAVVVLIIIVIVVAVSGSKSSNKPGSGSSSHPAAADVTVTCAAPDSLGFWHAHVTVTNHSSKASNYLYTVEWDDAAGNRLQSAGSIENAVAPGQTSTSDATAPAPSTGGTVVTCKAVDVNRLST